MDIHIIEETDPQAWEELLKSFPAGIFLAVPWLESFRSPNRTPLYLRCVSGDETIGIAAGLCIEPPHPLLKKIYKILRLYSGPALREPERELSRLCGAALIKFAEASGYTHLGFGHWDTPHTCDFEGLSFHKKVKEEYIIDLRGTLPDIQKKIRRTVKTKIKAAQKNGLTFHESRSPELVKELVSLLEETKSIRLSKGRKNYTYYYMPFLDERVIYKLLQNNIARIFYVKQQDHILCAQLIVTHLARAYALVGGTNQEGYELGAHAFIWMKEIETFKTEGIEYFNLGGVPDDEPSAQGLIFFKTSFGAEKHVCAGGWTPHLRGAFFNLLTNIYRNLPDKTIKHVISKIITGDTD